MEIKKSIMAVFLSITIVCSLFTSSSALADPILQEATKITYALFNTNEEGIEYDGDIMASYLKGLDGNEDYILTKGTSGGYAIFEKESLELIEYSDIGETPYGDLSQSEKVYGGPTQYFKTENNKVRNLYTDEVLELSEMVSIASQVKEKIETDRNNRIVKQDVIKDDTIVAEIQPIDNGMLELQSNEPTYEDLKDADLEDYWNRKQVSYYKYFIDLTAIGYGVNIDGTCSSVATQILLSYNNWINDGRLIPKQTSNSQEQFYLAGREDYLLDPYHPLVLGTNSLDISNDNIISFYEKIKSYINPYARYEDEIGVKPEHPLNNGASLSDIKNGILTFISEYTPCLNEEISCLHSNFLISHEQKCENIRAEIDSDRPLIASISYFKLDNETQEQVEKFHSVVVYGYQKVLYNEQELEGFIVHCGWGVDKSHAWLHGLMIICFFEQVTNIVT